MADETAFFAEHQNEPLLDQLGEAEQLTADQVLAKLNGYRRGLVPIDGHVLTTFIDVHDNLLYWAVFAWGDGFRGAIVD
jgi:phage terminase large subunit GpA-like protein